MDAGIDPATRDLAEKRITTLANAVYLRLMTPLGSWWADPTMGSKLYLLRREKNLARVARQAEAYAREALQPLVADGRAVSVAVTSHPRAPVGSATGWLVLVVDVVQAGGLRYVFEHPVQVI